MNLSELKTERDLKQIVIEELGYRAATGGLELTLPAETEEKLLEKKIVAGHDGFEVILARIKLDSNDAIWKKDASLRAIERDFINAVPKHERDAKLFVFCAEDGEFWHFVNARSSGSRLELRRFSITPINRKRLRTTQDRLALLRVGSSDTTQTLIDKMKSAFDVEAVTMDFFRTFAEKFLELAEIIKKARHKEYSYDKKKILDVAQIILNRLIFLKFIEQKGWLDNNKDYLYDKFQPYFEDKNSYWLEAVNPLFDLLSNPARGKKYEELGEIPFLNGGLFGAEPKYLFLVSIPNSFFQGLFENLFNRFNFTIEESSPSSVEVAVDPEMLGRIFEELVLRMEKVMEKGEAELEKELRRATGSYYTPRVAVFYMCREAIARRLAAQAGIDIANARELIDLAVDDFPDEKQAEKLSLSKTECRALLDVVKEISICDPAVGSGAFLLGSLQILVGIRRLLSLKVGEAGATRTNFNYTLKEEIIKKNLIGVDILRQAVHLCELRLWLSLAVDYEREVGKPIPTLPNLTYKVFRGDSIIDHLVGEQVMAFRDLRGYRADAAIEQKRERIRLLKGDYFYADNESKKEKLRQNIAKERLELTIDILEREAPQEVSQAELGFGPSINVKKSMQNMEAVGRASLIKQIKGQLVVKKYDAHHDKLSFVWLIDLVEYFADHDRGGFDIVLGNPPYGVKNESMEKGKERYGLGSKDSYGVFMAMVFQDLLKVGGILSFITSDTWQTIKTHKPLRRFMLDNAKVFHLIMMPPWLFGATVNTSILIAEKSERGRASGKQGERIIFENAKKREENELVACDFTRAEKNTNELDEYLYSLDEPPAFAKASAGKQEVSTPKKAVYRYKQGLIETNSNIPFFVGSPKLFALMNDTSAKTAEKEVGEIEKKKVKVRQIEFNGKIVEVARFGDIADVKVGLQTGDNQAYLFQNPEARGSYRSIGDYTEFLLTEDDLKKISGDEKLRLKVIEKGLHKSKTEKPFDPDLWFSGRYIAPHDKGGESDAESGFLPNYWQPLEYFIDWGYEAVNKLHDRESGAVIRNPETYFLEGITLSHTGMYAPTFRINNPGPYNVAGSGIFTGFDTEQTLGEICSKLVKYLFKIGINHSVNVSEDPIKEISFCISKNSRIQELVAQIISKQKQNPRYDYMSGEQKEIDKLVYEMYGLNKDDIREVETWYARRYPKLARFCDIA
ncbi:hypothetical protein A3B26_01760 [Candidatus Giovannonibacteria bacterium RIFCSPLOWO2_01_FULL_48_47]|nr:MAG: hypothetical protein A3B26_01760 [Candidatus Giovannonibacteria bacterium RIFCSPLOWO2_01_FULL_48_47]OGF94706.1 MAG: hypothetical protein A2433_03580 [Candidatus Giovannonibacteria bacterium RIFOXYC1_FULL_48_8]OGF96256.1 MAG: hypothetical protein A2613_01650 [Candidatus Giovannonibacteria bacterium RIFOXYD1_FULL_48_21]HBT81484.1 hypothetical protein [Candidatus Giovannonibacteria bacterium]